MNNIIFASRINKSGVFVESLALLEQDKKYYDLLGNQVKTSETVMDPVPEGLHVPKWDTSQMKWVEKLTADEIEKINSHPTQPSVEEQIKAMQEMINYILLGGGSNV